jgi:hypothetical protein
MTTTDAEKTITYLSNQLRLAHETATQQHQFMQVLREQLKKADAQIERLKQEAAAQPAQQ